jgi:hypothetical protein
VFFDFADEEFSAAEIERALFTKDLVGPKESKTPTKRTLDAMSPLQTESKRKRSQTGTKSQSTDGKVKVEDKSAADTRRSSSGMKSTDQNVINNSDSAKVSAADKIIGVPRVGVGVVVLNKEDEVLIGKRKSPHGQGITPFNTCLIVGTWSLPGVYPFITSSDKGSSGIF